MKNYQNNLPLVSVVIPCRNEEKFIGKCLDSLIEQDYPKENIEVLVVDGASKDGTRDIVRKYKEKNSFIKLLDNPDYFPSFALNKGIRESKGKIIIRCDAHSEYSKDYIQKSVGWLQIDKKIGNVGGIWTNKPSNDTPKTKGIAYTLSHPFCVGPSKYRTGVKKPIFVDTVPFGAWRKEIFNEVGLFDENFLKTQDLEFNMRLKKAGYKILLDPEIKSYYYPRESFKKLFKMMFQYGYWKVIVNKKLKILSSFRQLIPPFFVLYLFLSIFLGFLFPLIWIPFFIYLFLCIIFSLGISFSKRNIKLFPFSFLTFLISHIGYGLGYLRGFWDIWIMRKEDLAKRRSEITR